MVFPPTHWFQGLKGRRRLSDIEFLAKKDFDGKLVKNMGEQRTTIGTLATLTASSGKDLYVARAGVSVSFASGTIEVELRINGVAVETYLADLNGSGNYNFKSIGHKVAATKTIVLEWTVEGVTATMEGFLEGFEETTGETPVI